MWPISTIPFSIGVFVFMPWLYLLAVEAQAASMDLVSDQLRGPVRQVRLEFALSDKKSRVLKSETYDRRGFRKELTIFNRDGSVNSKTVFRYDMTGNKIEENLFNGTSEPIRLITWRYDRTQRKTEKVLFSGTGQPIHRTLWFYGFPGLLEERLVNPSRPIENKTTRFVYDAQGRMRSETLLDNQGTPIQERIFYYGKRGNLIRDALYRLQKTKFGRPIRVVLENRMYHPNGHLMETTEFLTDGRFWKRWRFTYDKTGNKIQETFYLKPGEIQSQWFYQMAPDNQAILEERYEKAGKPVFVKIHSSDHLNYSESSPRSKNIHKKPWLYQHRIDSHGNWFEKTVMKQKTHQIEPKQVCKYYRKIQYYQERQ